MSKADPIRLDLAYDSSLTILQTDRAVLTCYTDMSGTSRSSEVSAADLLDFCAEVIRRLRPSKDHAPMMSPGRHQGMVDALSGSHEQSTVNIESLAPAAYARSQSLWHYRSHVHTLASILAPGYFLPVWEMIKAGDFINLSGVDGGRACFVTRSDFTAVTVVPA